MATYQEIFELSENGKLRDRIQIACLVAAEAIRTENPVSALRRAWAKQVFNDPETAAVSALRCALIQNRASSVAQILAATDAALQTAVNASVDLLAGI